MKWESFLKSHVREIRSEDCARVLDMIMDPVLIMVGSIGSIKF